MSSPHSQAKALVSALVNARPSVLTLAAKEALWQQQMGKLSRASVDLALRALKELGWDGEAQALPEQIEFPQQEYGIGYLCKNCSRAVIDFDTCGPEAAIRVELERRARSRLKLHSDAAVGVDCKGILEPVTLVKK